MWQVRAGFTQECPACSYAGRYDGHSVTLYGPYRPINHRGMTLNCGQMTVTLTSPAEGVISVKMENFMGARDDGPAFQLHTSECGSVTADGDTVTLHSGKLSAVAAVQGE